MANTWPPNDCDLISAGDTAWILVSCALVLLMTPGLAFFYGGLVHRTSVLTIIMQCFISMGVTSIVWVVIGFSLAFGEDAGGVIGSPASYALLTNLDGCTPSGYPMASGNGSIPGILFAGYQMMFAIIAPALITGAFADRVRFKAYLLFIVLWLILVYCPFVHWVWSPNGFLGVWGVKDFAGGIVVHISAGFAALASIFVVGPRQYASDEDRQRMQVPHNRTFVALGTGLLWFGWFGFNGGSALASNGQASFALVNSSLAASVAMVTWMFIEWAHIGKPTLIGSCIGAIAGLATITPAAGFVRPWAGVLIGFVTAFGCYGCVQLRDILKWDDALDVWGVHGMGGLFGTLMLGFLADEEIGGQDRSGLFFGKQLAACVGTAIYSFVVSYVLLLLVNIVTPIVPDASEVAMGLDVSLHGEQAYDDEPIDLSKSSPNQWDTYGNSSAYEGTMPAANRAVPVAVPAQQTQAYPAPPLPSQFAPPQHTQPVPLSAVDQHAHAAFSGRPTVQLQTHPTVQFHSGYNQPMAAAPGFPY
eukprot:CAMPEP_0174929936 /NCGR_PEP_ID=MMETSP1355-20121228/29492_1 /TAXON_ID=464990 /ORGANISM="Hemiselmis tepida, Strain CCMP443" /LENGTH=530 /DNA_ID=CAMNT_0016176189 /DNA_START=34 /DNA_END=1626 /DNA_ORIENTATION=+